MKYFMKRKSRKYRKRQNKTRRRRRRFIWGGTEEEKKTFQVNDWVKENPNLTIHTVSTRDPLDPEKFLRFYGEKALISFTDDTQFSPVHKIGQYALGKDMVENGVYKSEYENKTFYHPSDLIPINNEDAKREFEQYKQSSNQPKPDNIVHGHSYFS